MDVGATRISAALVVALVATLLVLPRMGRRPIATGGINSDDEADYPLMARDMLVRGVWFDLHVRGERTWEKPPLLPWMSAAFARIRGSGTEAAAQLPVGRARIRRPDMARLIQLRTGENRIFTWATCCPSSVGVAISPGQSAHA